MSQTVLKLCSRNKRVYNCSVSVDHVSLHDARYNPLLSITRIRFKVCIVWAVFERRHAAVHTGDLLNTETHR